MTPEMQKIRATLEPFAAHADSYTSFDGQHDFLSDDPVALGPYKIKVGDLRNAAEALALIDGMEAQAAGENVRSPGSHPASQGRPNEASNAQPASPDSAGRATDDYQRGYEHGYAVAAEHAAFASPALSPAAQPDGLETTESTRANILRWLNSMVYAKHTLFAEIEALLRDVDRLLAERDAAIASSEADRAALTRCLETQRRVEAEAARLRTALTDIARQHVSDEFDEDEMEFGDIPGAYDTMIGVARSALAAEGGET